MLLDVALPHFSGKHRVGAKDLDPLVIVTDFTAAISCMTPGGT